MSDQVHPPGPRGSITVAAAQAGIAAAIEAAAARALGIVVVVAAPSGDPIALVRMDGVPPLAAESALRKCRTVALTWSSTESFAVSLKGDLASEPEVFHGMQHVGPMMTIGGGIPILLEGALVGAVAVSGASTTEDILIAEVAVAAIVAAARGR